MTLLTYHSTIDFYIKNQYENYIYIIINSKNEVNKTLLDNEKSKKKETPQQCRLYLAKNEKFHIECKTAEEAAQLQAD